MEESPEDETTVTPFYDEGWFSVRIVGSSDERKLVWLFDGDEDLPGDLFTPIVDDNKYLGNFAFGQVKNLFCIDTCTLSHAITLVDSLQKLPTHCV